MKILYLVALLSCYLFLRVDGQSTAEYFSREGLSINAFHYNQYDGQYSRSYTFFRKAQYCSEEVLEYINNENGHFRYLNIDGDRVYSLDTSNCQKTLIYDFGAEVNQIIDEGLFAGWQVTNITDVILENGETRKRIDVTDPNNDVTSWINGIGDIKNSLFPIFPYQEFFEGYDRFICAKIGDQPLWVNPAEADLCPLYSCVRPFINLDYTVDDFTLHVENQTIYGTTYNWDFGDGNFSADFNPIHEYSGPGCYTLQLMVTNECYESSVIQTYNVSVCIGDPWKPDYSNDTLALRVYRFSDSLEFIHGHYSKDLYKTEDRGLSWIRLPVPDPPPGVRRDINDLKMFDEDRGIMLCGHYSAESDQKAILVTADGGLTWEEKAEGSYYMLRGEVTSDGRGWAMGSSKRYLRTFDFGQTWENIVYPGSFQIYNVQFIHDSLLIGRSFTGLQPNGTYHLVKSRDNGLTWEKINLPVFVREWIFFDENNGYGYREDFGMSKTTDGGLTWTKIVLPFYVSAYSFYDLNSGWLVDDTELVHYTSDGMNHFDVSNCGKDILRQLTAISSNTAFAVRGTITWGTVFTGRTKLIFDENNIVDCYDADNDLDGFPAYQDCDDQNAGINPGMIELPYNGINDDCDSTTLDDDLDLDGFIAELDCNDENALINPNQYEIVYNGHDDDCDSTSLDDDLDMDGFGAELDCNDENASIHPDQNEITYNGINDDCDSTTLDDDLDQDGYILIEDCNDLFANIHPGATEIPGNGIDEDCNGEDLITSTLDLNTLSVNVYPIPTSGILYLSSAENYLLKADIIDLTGKLLLSENGVQQIDLSSLTDGLYILKCSSPTTGLSMIKKIVLNKSH